MDLRFCHCLRNGLPLDIGVRDLPHALELGRRMSERSVFRGRAAWRFPTRAAAGNRCAARRRDDVRRRRARGRKVDLETFMLCFVPLFIGCQILNFSCFGFGNGWIDRGLCFVA